LEREGGEVARLVAVSREGEEKEMEGCRQYALVIFANH